MRVHLICGIDLCNNALVTKTYNVLADQLSREKTVVLAEENPDIVHVVGAWSTPAIAIVKKSIKRHIPFVHTPLGSLSPWNKPTISQQKLSSMAQTIVASGVMEQRLLSKQGNNLLQLIFNPVTTKTTTPSEMAYAYMAIYERNIKANDTLLWENINDKIALLNEDDDKIIEICRYLLYAQYLYEKNNIPKPFLQTLTALFVNSDYNEDDFTEVLKLIRLYEFTRSLEYVMQEETALTEGFMPIPMNNDKGAKEMLKTVTNYKK